jgi:hypothetical protein
MGHVSKKLFKEHVAAIPPANGPKDRVAPKKK